MSAPASTSAQRAVDRREAKLTERRGELAAAALKTLSEQGYARTSLRDIAANSEFSHGVLHYYFQDKIDLITHCVREYKAQCVTRYDGVVTTATTTEELLRGFQEQLTRTLVTESSLHRLWYDLRTQSMFEPSLRPDVVEIDLSLERMVWRIVTRYAELADVELRLTPPLAYAVFDGLFVQALNRQLAGDQDAAGDLRDAVARLFPRLLG